MRRWAKGFAKHSLTSPPPLNIFGSTCCFCFVLFSGIVWKWPQQAFDAKNVRWLNRALFFDLKYLVSLFPIMSTLGWSFLQIRTASVCSGCCRAGLRTCLQCWAAVLWETALVERTGNYRRLGVGNLHLQSPVPSSLQGSLRTSSDGR